MWTEPGFESLPPEALRVRRIRGGAAIAVVAFVLALVDVIVRSATDLDIPLVPVSIPAMIVIVLLIGWFPWTRLAWRAWGWRLDDDTFQTRSGVYTKVWTGVPRDRVQFVEVAAGPLQRWAGLATLVVRTAGVRTPAVTVEDLRTDVAEGLRAELSPRSDDDGAPVIDSGDADADPDDTRIDGIDLPDPHPPVEGVMDEAP